MKVIIFSTATCPYCQMLKDFLKEKNVPFEEKLVDQDSQAKEEMMEKSGGYLGVPFTLIIRDDGQEEKVVGFDKAKLEQILT